MDNEKIIRLMEGYESGTLTPAEELAYLQWYRQAGLAEFDGVFAARQNLSDVSSSYPDQLEAFRERMEAAIQDFEEADQPAASPVFSRPRRGMIRYISVAAAVLVCVSIGGWWWSNANHPAPKSAPIVRYDGDALPGSDRAVLTLSNGARIILDSTADGLLTRQGSTQVVKHNGQLAYKTADQIGGREKDMVFNTLTTPRGGQYKLQLPDGSRVWLDAASSISYPTAFTGKERRVRITGQAYLEMARNPSQPFITEVNGMEIKDMGTAFNISAYNDETTSKITLVSGSIEVGLNAERAVLRPAQQFQVTGGKWKIVSQADLEEALAWKENRFFFGEKTDIATIMRQLARWYDVDVKYQGQVDIHFGGRISRQINVSKVLEKLALTGEVQFRIEGKTIIVTP